MRLLLIAGVLAVGLLPQAAAAQDAACRDSLLAVEIGGLPRSHVPKIRAACPPGRPITLPRGQTFLIESLCDFGKAMVPSGRSVTCVVARP